MKKERFKELSEALRQAKAVRRGEAAPARVWEVTRGTDGQLHRRQLDPLEYQRAQKDWADVLPSREVEQEKLDILDGKSPAT